MICPVHRGSFMIFYIEMPVWSGISTCVALCLFRLSLWSKSGILSWRHVVFSPVACTLFMTRLRTVWRIARLSGRSWRWPVWTHSGHHTHLTSCIRGRRIPEQNSACLHQRWYHPLVFLWSWAGTALTSSWRPLSCSRVISSSDNTHMPCH